MSELRDILVGIGVDPGEIVADSRVRAHLALDSTETVELESRLRTQFGIEVDLWGAHDYSVAELAGLLGARTR